MQQIRQRQNEEQLLSIQFVARYYYNKAEVYNFVSWVLCLLSFFFCLLPQTLPNMVLYGIPFLIEILAAVFCYLFSNSISLGSQLRATFDEYVLGFSEKLNIKQELLEKTISVIKKNQEQAEIQKKNTGKDNPPGVRDWYNTDSDETGISAIFVCQKENKWWDKKLTPWKILLNSIFIIVCILFLWLMVSFKYISVCQIFLSAVLIFRLIERVCVNISYYNVGKEIDGIEKVLEVSKTEEQISYLQSAINNKRSLNIVGINFIHKLLANKLSDIYKQLRKQ